ncbi:two-component system sensor histidine kinase NtrB [Limisphaera sp. VF-2]|jgi:signal transduction histidine kinase|uniref:two-component system sensor histidine kinase NtrB n=1 Tax=Limisphaera sp. VF-2 TaxID=3400418 RepID=UPI00176F9D51
MDPTRQSRWVYGLLLLAWLGLLAWQAAEHQRVRHNARQALIRRAQDISTTLGVVLRSQRRFGIIPKDRLESTLQELVKPDELMGVAMLNAAGEVVASAGTPIDFELRGLVPTGQHWGPNFVALMNLVDLGTNLTAEPEPPHPTLVLPRDELPPFGRDRPGPPSSEAEGRPQPRPGPPPPSVVPTPPPPRDGTGPADRDEDRSRNRRSRGDRRPPFGRPFWMSEEEYQEAIRRQGLHSFVLMLSTANMVQHCRQDLWQRSVIAFFATLACLAFGLAWRNLLRTADLEVRLARAAAINRQLQEMNLVAAGLAHETKNPLNIIRTTAQLLSQEHDLPESFRAKARQIIEEADRVTAQLNEFINYSRPREVRRSTVALSRVLEELRRTLGHDLEDKQVQLHYDSLPAVEADEQLLRQALFNLLLNAIQAVPVGGRIEVAAVRIGPSQIALEVRDNGPGVPPEHRTEIFKPYFTTHPKGTGLGLAVVRQIVLAHGWDIEYVPNQPQGAIFRIAPVRTVGGA